MSTVCAQCVDRVKNSRSSTGRAARPCTSSGTPRSPVAPRTAPGRRTLAEPDDAAEEIPPCYGIMPKIAEMLGWLARHRPYTAGRVITSVTGEAERQLGIPRHVTEQSIRIALDLDGYPGDTLDE